MQENEADVLLTILPVLALDVAQVFGWFEPVVSDSRWVLGIPSPSDPEVSGARSIKRQLEYMSLGKSRWRGPAERSAHVRREAIHLVIRHRETGKVYFYDPDSEREDVLEANQVFLLVVERMERGGWTWGGRWKSLKDWQHFQKRVLRASPVITSGGDTRPLLP